MRLKRISVSLGHNSDIQLNPESIYIQYVYEMWWKVRVVGIESVNKNQNISGSDFILVSNACAKLFISRGYAYLYNCIDFFSEFCLGNLYLHREDVFLLKIITYDALNKYILVYDW